MIRNEVLLNIITEALSAYIKERCNDSFQQGVERGRFEERCELAQRQEQERRNAGN